MSLQKKDVRKFIRVKRNVKRCIYQIKKELNEQYGIKSNQDGSGNRKLFWKEMSKIESCSRIKYRIGRLTMGEY